MKEFKKYFLYFIVTFFLLFAVAETIARFLTVPGTVDFIERRIIEEDLKPQKPADQYRILFYGESTMHGNHLFPKSTIRKWMSLYLESLLGAEKAKRFKGANLGRLGASSDFISQAFFDTAVYKPDLVVFYTAHNDFIQLENRKVILGQKVSKKKRKKFFQSVLKKSYFLSALNRFGIARW